MKLVDSIKVTGEENETRPLAIAGSVVGLLGIFAIAFPLATGISLTVLLGALLVLSGIVHGAHAFTVRGWSGSLWQVTLGVVSVLAGATLLVNPLVGLASLTLLVIAYLLVDGIAELLVSLRMVGEERRNWVAASGIVSLALAALLWAGFPATAAWAIGLLVGASLLVTGISMVMVAMAGGGLEEPMPEEAEPRAS
ncbi:HdeD family acid-resistance protein [Natrialbaceae archaeon A-gly3]